MGRRGARLIEEALEATRYALDGLGVPWMVLGGIAVIARGVRRMTADIDVVVLGEGTSIRALLGAFVVHEIEPRIPDAERFARRSLVLLMRHQPTRVDLDVSLGWSEFEREALASRRETSYGRVKVPMATAEDLVVFKAVAARPVDRADIEALLLLHPEIDTARARANIEALAELAEAPEIVSVFEDAVSAARRATQRARPSAVKRGPARKKRS